jgi:hypothetical protein
LVLGSDCFNDASATATKVRENCGNGVLVGTGDGEVVGEVVGGVVGDAVSFARMGLGVGVGLFATLAAWVDGASGTRTCGVQPVLNTMTRIRKRSIAACKIIFVFRIFARLECLIRMFIVASQILITLNKKIQCGTGNR